MTELPLLDYPSTKGINALLILLLIAAVGAGAFAARRRLRASHGGAR